jgi:N-acetylglucosamine-6-phosphate deacetylase
MATTALINAQLWIGDGRSSRGYVIVENAVIADVGTGPPPSGLADVVVDLAGMALSPGLIDLMVLGGFGYSLLRDPPSQITRRYLRYGVTGIQFCVASLPWSSLCRASQHVQEAMQEDTDAAAAVLGLYLEGPFQQPHLTGASARDFALAPTEAHVRALIEQMGAPVRMVNVAPGLEQDTAAIRQLVGSGKIVTMAHSDAPASRVLPCLEAGTSVLGHIWDNGAPVAGDSGVQQPSIDQVALVDDRVEFIHLICDGVHADPVMVRMTHRCRGVEALCLVTDANVASGCPDGPFQWDDGRTFVKSGGVCRTGEGWLSGSALLLPDMFRNFVSYTGAAPSSAIRTVTWNPARSLGKDDQMGLLAPGRLADMVAWDEQLRVRRVWRRGLEVEDLLETAEVAVPNLSEKA